MAKKKITIKRKVEKPTLDEQDKRLIRNAITNASSTRSDLMRRVFDPRRDINDECGYPKTITIEQYKTMYEREGTATRVVSIFPEESWAEDPKVMEDDDTNETEFEKAWVDLERKLQLFSYMARIDELSGIGQYGILLLGLDDGGDMKDPVNGLNDKGEKVGKAQHQLLYLRAIDESCVKIKSTEKNPSNPRFGKPVIYTVKFEETATNDARTGTSLGDPKEVQVHWTRVIHVADNRKSSEIYGVPRMQSVYNRLHDLRKITGGSAEMFWKGGFPGYSFEMDSNAKPIVADSAEDVALKNQIASYADGLQRYLTVQGIEVKSLSPQVADPKAHVEIQLEIIAIDKGIPKRIFMGSEQAKLASAQDSKSWNKRIARRQNKYLTPYIIRPLIDRLIAFGTLPEPKEYDIEWLDLDAPSDKDKAEVMKIQVEAFGSYVQKDVEMLIPPELFLKMFAGMDADEIKEIIEAAEGRQKEVEEAQKKEQDELRGFEKEDREAEAKLKKGLKE